MTTITDRHRVASEAPRLDGSGDRVRWIVALAVRTAFTEAATEAVDHLAKTYEPVATIVVAGDMAVAGEGGQARSAARVLEEVVPAAVQQSQRLG